MTISDKPLYPHPTNPKKWYLPPALGGDSEVKEFSFLGNIDGYDLYAVVDPEDQDTDWVYVKDNVSEVFLGWDPIAGMSDSGFIYLSVPPPQHIIDFVKAHHKLTT